MSVQYLMFVAIQWLGPVAVLAITITALAAAIRRPAVWSIAYCLAAGCLLVGMVTNHLALSTFGTQMVTSGGEPVTRIEPILRAVGLLSQFVGFNACLVGSLAAIRTLNRSKSKGLPAQLATDEEPKS